MRVGRVALRCANTMVLPSRVGLKAHTASAPKAAQMLCSERSKLVSRPNRFTVMQPSSLSTERQSV